MGDTGQDEAVLTKLVCDTLEKRIFLLCLLTLSEGDELPLAGRAKLKGTWVRVICCLLCSVDASRRLQAAMGHCLSFPLLL